MSPRIKALGMDSGTFQTFCNVHMVAATGVFQALERSAFFYSAILS